MLAALDLGAEQKLKARRDNAVHSYWAVDGQPGIRANRFPRREGGRIIVGNATDLFAAANLLFRARRPPARAYGHEWVAPHVQRSTADLGQQRS